VICSDKMQAGLYGELSSLRLAGKARNLADRHRPAGSAS
jgi:hypothetical protein